jgi:hypothetical protein
VLLYLPSGINARAQAVQLAAPYQVMGFNYYWLRSFGGGGFADESIAPTLMQDEQQNYNMNMAVIDVTANTVGFNNALVYFQGDNAIDTYPDDVYTKLVQAARTAHLTPVFKLTLRGIQQTQSVKNKDPWPGLTGKNWDGINRSDIIDLEQAWFDSYTDYAVHFAALAQKLNMPFFIMGTGYYHMTGDSDQTAKGTPGPGDTAACQGRRDCEWRHVIAAIRNQSFEHYSDGKAVIGGGFTGKVIYAAGSRIDAGSATPEWDPSRLTWWDAIDIIGIEAYFPLTNEPDPSIPKLGNAWKGTGDTITKGNQGNVVQKLWDLNRKTQRNILFTGAGYESIPQSNQRPGSWSSNDVSDFTTSDGQLEQSYDMQALYGTFSVYPWWLGVVWSNDYAVAPRSKLDTAFANTDSTFFIVTGDDPLIDHTTGWYGDCFAGCNRPAKQAGIWLNSIKTKPLPANP